MIRRVISLEGGVWHAGIAGRCGLDFPGLEGRFFSQGGGRFLVAVCVFRCIGLSRRILQCLAYSRLVAGAGKLAVLLQRCHQLAVNARVGRQTFALVHEIGLAGDDMAFEDFRDVGNDLSEFVDVESEGCSLGPRSVAVNEATAGKIVAIFALPGAYTPTCSAKHVPGYLEQAGEFKKVGVDEIWCLSVNDPFVMGAWGREQKSTGIVRMMADGNAAFCKALGLDADFSKFGMGTRSQRYSMVVVDGVVTQLNVEQGGGFDVSNAETMLGQLA